MARHQASGRSGLGFGLATTTMLLWGALPLALQLVLAQLDALTLTGFRFLAAGLCLGGWLWARGKLPSLRSLDGRGRAMLAVATVFLAINYAAFLYGLDFTTAAHAQVLIQLAPLLLAFGGIFVFSERFLPLQWAGMAILLGGLGLFFAAQILEPPTEARDLRFGTWMMLLAAVTWAIYGLAQKQLLTRMPSQALMLCIYLGCAALFAPVSDPAAILELDALGAGMLLFTAANTLVGYGTFSAALEHWEASRVSAVLAVTPLATLAFSVAAAASFPDHYRAEDLGSTALLGAFIVVAGSLVVSLAGRRAPG